METILILLSHSVVFVFIMPIGLNNIGWRMCKPLSPLSPLRPFFLHVAH